MYESILLSSSSNYSSPISSSSSNGGSSKDHKLEYPLLSIVIVLHLFIIALGILGNSLIIYLVVADMRLRTARNAFMLNLTVSNLVLVAICTPSFLVSIASSSWVMGAFWCKCLHSLQVVIVLVCAFSIAMIAVDRWIFIVYAARSKQLTRVHCILLIIGVWVLAVLLAVPTFLSRSTGQLYDQSLFDKINELRMKMILTKSTGEQQQANSNYTELKFAYDDHSSSNLPKSPIYCFETWPNPLYKRIYILVLFVLEFVLPCLVMLVTYVWIIRFLKAQDDKMNHYELLHKRLVQKERHHEKSCKILSVVCVTFIVCCLPLSFFNIKAEFDVNKYLSMTTTGAGVGGGDESNEKEIYVALTVLTTLEELNAILSPLLYGWMNQNFRNAINQRLRALKTRLIKNNRSANNEHFNKRNILLAAI